MRRIDANRCHDVGSLTFEGNRVIPSAEADLVSHPNERVGDVGMRVYATDRGLQRGFDRKLTESGSVSSSVCGSVGRRGESSTATMLPGSIATSLSRVLSSITLPGRPVSRFWRPMT